MQLPLISILTPFKNTAKYLNECINSIVNQTYTNWELLIIDDGSTDDSYNIISKYSKKDTRIKLLKNDGSGIIAALQTAFTNCSGEFVTRMDSDDIMPTNKLEIMAKSLIDSGNGHVALGLVKYFSDEGISDGYNKYEKWLNKLTSKGENYSEIYKECVIPSPCWMTYKEDFIACEAFEPNRYPEDYDLTFRFYKYGLKCIPSSDLLHYWRDYPIRTSRTHEHYAQNYFLDIKLHYFLELDFQPNRPLVVWGAGFKGKTIAKALVEKDIPFYWICDNPKKIGKHIYNQQLKAFEFLEQLNNPQSIITVANTEAQKDIRAYLHNQKMTSMNDYFFFC
ncbi:glycosyltransferase family 2 protein [Pontimicrobium aquaticum]|uniref:Glycosyltransferase family 2 protein n=1 Tax=Pontimicrobium aquaticum TaxID=2565367 RepID=A0A4U0EQX4_9FLAO|nr:glycosyltransferase family 2 protein [Pontimicrobium aquaticum]TJY33948.1 glycosyltransferase family 2 protein [Pontimicrobium aquaticum]